MEKLGLAFDLKVSVAVGLPDILLTFFCALHFPPFCLVSLLLSLLFDFPLFSPEFSNCVKKLYVVAFPLFLPPGSVLCCGCW